MGLGISVTRGEECWAASLCWIIAFRPNPTNVYYELTFDWLALSLCVVLHSVLLLPVLTSRHDIVDRQSLLRFDNWRTDLDELYNT